MKIKKEILDRVDKLIENKFKHVKYANKRHFVNVAVLELLSKEE